MVLKMANIIVANEVQNHGEDMVDTGGMEVEDMAVGVDMDVTGVERSISRPL